MGFFSSFSTFGFKSGRAASAAAAPATTLPATNRTAEYISSVDGDFSLTGASVNTHAEAQGVTDLNLIYISDTKATLDTANPINTTGKTVNTNNADCLHGTGANGTLSDFWPAGTGTMFLVMYADSHPDRFNAPDWFMRFGTALRISTIDLGKLRVGTNSDAQVVEPAFSLDAWHLVTIRNGIGAGALKVQVDDDAEVTATGAAVTTLTDVMRLFYNVDDAGRFDGPYAHIYTNSDIFTDNQVTSAKEVLRNLYADV